MRGRRRRTGGWDAQEKAPGGGGRWAVAIRSILALRIASTQAFRTFAFLNSYLFRISCFGFRICHRAASLNRADSLRIAGAKTV